MQVTESNMIMPPFVVLDFLYSNFQNPNQFGVQILEIHNV